jgi:sugar phosphate isomerase/epimerase
MDIEGSEGKAIESGIELISEYHIPFLFIEFNPDYLKMQGTDPKHFLETFERNGYKISTIDFFNNRYSSIEEIMKLSATNLYIIYQGFVE